MNTSKNFVACELACHKNPTCYGFVHHESSNICELTLGVHRKCPLNVEGEQKLFESGEWQIFEDTIESGRVHVSKHELEQGTPLVARLKHFSDCKFLIGMCKQDDDKCTCDGSSEDTCRFLSSNSAQTSDVRLVKEAHNASLWEAELDPENTRMFNLRAAGSCRYLAPSGVNMSVPSSISECNPPHGRVGWTLGPM